MRKLKKVRVIVNASQQEGRCFGRGELKDVYYEDNKPYIWDNEGDRLFFNLDRGTYGWFEATNVLDFDMAEGDYAIEEVEDLSLKHLREKALQALDDGLLDRITVKRTRTPRVLTFDNLDSMRAFKEQDISEGLQYIKSLYKESFKVETQADVEGIRVGAEGVLLNGEEFRIVFRAPNAEWGVRLNASFSNSTVAVSLPLLKGATITQ